MAPRTPKLDGDPRVELIDLARVYSDGTLGLPSRFFPEPELPDVALTPLGDGPHGTQIVDLTYTTNYQPFHPASRDGYLAHRENETAHARWWTSDRGRPTIVMIHGWGGGNHWVTARAFVVPYWLKHGYDVVSFVLPYHGERAPAGEVGRAISVAESAAHERSVRARDLRSARVVDVPARARRHARRRDGHEPGRLHGIAVGEHRRA